MTTVCAVGEALGVAMIFRMFCRSYTVWLSIMRFIQVQVRITVGD